MKFKVTRIVVVCGIFLSLFLILASCANDQTIEKKLRKIDQDPLNYAKSSLNITKEQQAQFTSAFLTHYFSPWDEATPTTITDTRDEVKTVFAIYLRDPGWGENGHPIQQEFIQRLLLNADLNSYPNFNRPAIIVNGTYVRSLPTLSPSFGNVKIAGQGYPFDNLEEAFIAQGTPIRILHKSSNGRWFLITTSSYYGWVASHDVGLVSPEFMAKWKQSHFVVAIRDNVPLLAGDGLVLASSRIGVLYPKVTEDNLSYQVFIPMLDEQGNAQFKTLSLKKQNVRDFPLNITEKDIATVARNMIGTPYGWGGEYQLRDCSATTSDLFSVFGYWLPRNSAYQARMGEIISLVGMTSKEKLKMITQQGIPFFTLLHAPGHITLYLGANDGKAYVLQDVWGLHTINVLNQEGRAVIGKTVITPVDFGNDFINVKQTLLDRFDSMTIMSSPRK
jgi:cell wall-associated NlpC family hydrolase